MKPEQPINRPVDEEWKRQLPKQRRLWAALVCIPALVLILSYFGVIPWMPPKRCKAVFCDPYHWQILVIGIAFLCAALTFIIPARWPKLAAINGLILLACFLAGVAGSLFFR
jgi:hypothetical protein